MPRAKYHNKETGKWEYADSAYGSGGTVTDEQIASAVEDYMAENPIETPEADLREYVKKSEITLGFGADGKLYIMVSGVAVGDGVEINGEVVPSEGVAVFVADFSGVSPSAEQFYAWEGRVYDGAIYDALENIQCDNGVATLKSVYDTDNSRWVKQIMTTGGLFESDNFTCKFKAKFCGLAGSWNNVITYGTGTHWTDYMYSDGVKWPAGGEIDAFEQAGGYSEVPNTMHTPTVHYGSGTNSGYPNTHEKRVTGTVEFTTDEWHDFKFSLNNGYVKVWIDGVLVGENDFSDCAVSNNYMCDYKPFLKPQAFYIDGSCYSGSTNTHTDYEYEFEVSDFEIIQDKNVECTGLEIYPQMWAKGTNLIFPVGAEVYFDRVYTPSNTSNKACKWESSNPSVATVVQGYVKILAVGTTTITATCGNASAQYVLTAATEASVPCAKIITDSDEGIIVSNNDSITITPYLYPGFTTDEVSWITSDSGVVTVANGVVSGVAAGEASIIVSCGLVSAVVPVSVVESTKPYMSYDFSPLAQYMYAPYVGNETKIVSNNGSGGSQFDINLTANITYYDENKENYSPDGYVGSFSGQTATLTETINFNTQPVAYVYTLKDANSGVRQYNNGNNANRMPSLVSKALRYGNVNPIDVALSGNDRIIAYSNGTTAYAYHNGTLLASGSSGYITDAFSYLYISGLTGGNLTHLDVYVGKTFTEDELIVMSTPA